MDVPCLILLCGSVWYRVNAHQQCKSQFKRRSTANDVEIKVPVPQDADSPKFKVM